jgi:hypothetical protein
MHDKSEKRLSCNIFFFWKPAGSDIFEDLGTDRGYNMKWIVGKHEAGGFRPPSSLFRVGTSGGML